MQFLNIAYNILVHPSQEFKVVSVGPVPKDILLAYGAVIVFLVSGIGVLYSPMIATTSGLFLKFLLSATTGLILWLFTGTVFSTAAYIFGTRGRPQTLLILTAYATLPWVLLPSVMLFKGTLGAFGQTISILGSLGIWLWTVILFLMALRYTYNLTLERVLLAAGLPIMMTFLGIGWISGFFFNLVKFLSSPG